MLRQQRWRLRRRLVSAAMGSAVTIPANTVAPVLSGTPQVGQTLSVTTGTWTGSPTSYTYHWLEGVTFYHEQTTYQTERVYLAISGATSSTFLLTHQQLGSFIYVEVTAINGSGSAVVPSNVVGPVHGVAQLDFSVAGNSGYLTAL